MQTAADLMTRSVLTVRPDTSMEQAMQLITLYGVTGLPVVDRTGWLHGIVSDFQLMRLVGEPELAPQPVRDHMTREVLTVTEDTLIENVIEMLTAHRLRRIPVLHEGKVVGVISRGDIMRYARLRMRTASLDGGTRESAQYLPHVLLVNDDAEAITLYQRLIERTFVKHVVVGAAETESAARIWLTDNTCDLLIVDLDVAECDGLQLLEYAKGRNPWTQVILVTGHASWDSLASAMKHGASNYLLKPVDHLELIELIQEAYARWKRWARVVERTVEAEQEAATA